MDLSAAGATGAVGRGTNGNVFARGGGAVDVVRNGERGRGIFLFVLR